MIKAADRGAFMAALAAAHPNICGIKDTVEAIHRDPDGFFKGGAR